MQTTIWRPLPTNGMGTPNPLDGWRRWVYTVQDPQNSVELEPRKHVAITLNIRVGPITFLW